MRRKILSSLFCLPVLRQAQNLYNSGFNGSTAGVYFESVQTNEGDVISKFFEKLNRN